MNSPRKASLAVLAGVAITGVVGAAAASLGGVNNETLGAGSDAVESCNTDGVDVAFTTAWDTGKFVVQDVVVTSIDPECNGNDIEVVLTDGTDELGSATGTVAGGAATLDVSGEDVDAEDVEGVGVVISG